MPDNAFPILLFPRNTSQHRHIINFLFNSVSGKQCIIFPPNKQCLWLKQISNKYTRQGVIHITLLIVCKYATQLVVLYINKQFPYNYWCMWYLPQIIINSSQIIRAHSEWYNPTPSCNLRVSEQYHTTCLTHQLLDKESLEAARRTLCVVIYDKLHINKFTKPAHETLSHACSCAK